MTVSVCMGTYNGAKYIREQLESIKNQTREPDEVIICDDGSKDNTVELIKAFMSENHPKGRETAGMSDRYSDEQSGELQEKQTPKPQDGQQEIHGCEWKLFINEKNMGYPSCFYHAMSLCSGDIVFLADQDDIWDERKLEKMCAVFEQQEDVQALVCKFGLIDSDGDDVKTVMAPTHAGDTAELRAVSAHDVFYKGEWPGMVMAYRRKWYLKKAGGHGESGKIRDESRALEPGEAGGYQTALPHDLLIAAWAAEEGAFRQLDQELAWHRRHDNNAGQEEHKIKKLLNKERKLREIEVYLHYLDIFSRENMLRTEEGRQALEEKQRSMSGRYEALRSGKIRKVLGEAFRNRKDVRLVTVVCDVAICRQKRRF